MARRCQDPVCPANQPRARPCRASTSKGTKKRTKSRSTEKRARSPGRACRNKKCQATVDCATSTPRPRSKSACRASKKRSCHCGEERKAREEVRRRPKKRSRCVQSPCRSPRFRSPCRTRCSKKKRKTQARSGLCICVRKESSTLAVKKRCKCPSKCTILAKYDECCCAKNKKKNRGSEVRVCRCKPASSKPECGKRNNASSGTRRPCRTCPVRRCCSKISLRNNPGRRVKFRG